jgi:hypothetical protein
MIAEVDPCLTVEQLRAVSYMPDLEKLALLSTQKQSHLTGAI